jgi:hypothetical protein
VKRLGDSGLGVLTWVHKGVGVTWAMAVLGVLVLGLLGLTSGRVAWPTISVLARVASTASVLMLLLGLGYNVFTEWRILSTTWLLAKWGLYLAAVASSGYTISAAKGQLLAVLIGVSVVQLIALAAAMSIGAHLDRSRRAGLLARGREDQR